MNPIICIAIVLRLGHAAGGVCVLIWTCWGLLLWLVVTHSVVYYATDQCRKKLEACINAEGGHSEHLLYIAYLTFQLPHITTGSFQSHRRQPTSGSFQNLQRVKERNKPSIRWKNFFCNSHLVWWHFQVGWASRLQSVFFGDNINNQKYVWRILLKITFFGFSKVKWFHVTGEVDKSISCLCHNFSWFNVPKS